MYPSRQTLSKIKLPFICFLLLLSLSLNVTPLAAEQQKREGGNGRIENPSAAAVDQAKKLFDLTFAGNFMDQFSNQIWGPIAADLKAKNPDMNDQSLESLRQEFIIIQNEALADMLKEAPYIYARYFSLAELKQLYDFQNSAVGRKSLQVMPKIMGEMMPMIMKHSQQAGPRMLERMKEKIKKKGFRI